MMTFLILLGAFYAVGALAMAVAAHNAPEGWQDETGFHILWRNDDPDRADVACVWDFAPAPAAI